MLSRTHVRLRTVRSNFFRNLRRELLLRVLKTSAASAGKRGSPLRTRRHVARLARLAPPIRGVSSRYDRLGGVNVRWLVPKGTDGKPTTVFYLHGGGFVLCDLRTHRMLASNVAKAANAKCVMVAYRRAPNHPFPTPVNDCLRAYDALVHRGTDPRDIVVAGDSAGGNLALALVQRLRDRGDVLPRALCLISPWVDLAMKGVSVHTNESKDYLQPSLLKLFADSYLQGHDPTDPMASPVHADFRGFPPMLVQIGTHEMLLSEVRLMTARAREQGVTIELQEWEQMFHAWHGFAFAIVEAKQAFQALGRFIRSNVASGDQSSAARPWPPMDAPLLAEP